MTDPAELAGLLEGWLPGRRWYATKHLAPRLESVVVSPAAGARAAGPDGMEFLEVFATDRPEESRIVYQVPLARRPVLPDDVPPAAVVGRDREGRWLTDATHEPAYLRWLLPRMGIGETRVLAGEQSNTSVICESAEGPFDVIVKLFRVLDEGSNPEVELQEALSRTGSPHVPRFVGAGWGGWTRGGAGEFGHLWVASEFIDGAEDAWRVAGTAVAGGEDVDAEGLGRAVAGVHLALARELPTVSVDDAGRASAVGAWRRRARLANSAVPALAGHREQVARVFEAAGHSPWPELQRIHGDLHLGQVMLSRRGWILLDFEGEPLRRLEERRQPDLALRDVAGMLRSFDYAAGAAPGERELAWVERHRERFLDGYAEVAGDPRWHGALLQALELDKALYEARYEAGNRPDWLGIPLRGIARLTSAGGC